MQQETSKGISKSKLCFLFLLEIITLAAAVSTVVLLSIWGYIGFDGGSPIVLGTCSNSYNLIKYSNLTLIIELIFIASVVTAFSSCLVFIIMMVWTIRKCKNDDDQTQNGITKKTRYFLYFLISLMLLASFIPVAYYVSFIIEMDSCSPTKNNSQLLILLIIASSVFACSFLIWIILGCSSCGQNSQQKYKYRKDIQSQSKEEKKQQKKSEEDRPIQRYNARIIKHEETKENIFESPSRQHIQRQYPKNKEEKHYIEDFQPKNVVEIQNLMNQSVPLKTKYQTPVLNLHPSLRPKHRRFEERKQEDVPTIKQPLYDRNWHQQNKQSRNYNRRDDQESLKREEKRYLSRPEGGILPLSGVHERNYRHQIEDRGRNRSERDQRRERDRYDPNGMNRDRERKQRRYRDDRQNERIQQEYRDNRQVRNQKDDQYERDDKYNKKRRSPPRQQNYEDQKFARGKEDYNNFRNRYGRDDYMGAINPSHYQEAPPRRRQRDRGRYD